MNKKYLRNGIAVHVIQKLENGKYLVGNIWENCDYNGDCYEDCDEFGNLYIVGEVYDNPPIEVKNEEVQKLESQIKDLKDKKREIENQIKNLEKTEKYALEKVKHYDQLKYLFDFIDGKITHYVIDRYSNIEIVKFEDALSEHMKDATKLLTLFGNSKGDLNWKLSQYSDGSGYNNTSVIPCLSYEEALEEAQKLLDKKIEESKYHRLDYIKLAKEHGLELPKNYIEDYILAWEKNNQEKINNLINQIETLKKEKPKFNIKEKF